MQKPTLMIKAWGTSAVGKADNNWGGMTWTGQGNRPSGVTVTQGSARPSNEGGQSDKIEVNIEGIEISINGVKYTISKKPV